MKIDAKTKEELESVYTEEVTDVLSAQREDSEESQFTGLEDTLAYARGFTAALSVLGVEYEVKPQYPEGYLTVIADD